MIRILEATKNVMLGPICKLCNGRKRVLFRGEHYCPDCEKYILELDVAKGL